MYLSKTQRNIWLLAAIPTSMAMIKASPLWAIPALCLAAILYYIVYETIPDGSGLAVLLPKWILILEWCFLLLVVGKTAGLVEECWPKGSTILFALVLITLADAASGQGLASMGRVASGLGLITLIIMAVILMAVAIEVPAKQEAGSWMDGFPALSSAMLPLCALFLPVAKQPKEKGLWGGIFVSAILALYCATSGKGMVPILYAIEGLEMFGVFRRFEAVASCLLTVGVFLILTIFSCSAREIAAEIEKEGRLRGIFYPASIGVYLLERYISDALIQYGALLFWGVLPVLTLLVVPPEAAEKRFKKSKKRC